MLALWTALSLLAVCVLSTAGTRAFAATAPTVGGKATVTNTDGDPIGIRTGPGSEYDKIAAAWEGQTVTILAGPTTDGQGIVWFKVQAPSATGWMMAQYLEGTAPPALRGPARVANTDGDPLRVRSEPNGRVLIMLDPGTAVEVVEGPVTDNAGVVWYRITARGTSGWAMAQYLARTDSDESRTSAPAAQPASESRPAPTPRPTAQPASAPPPAPANGDSASPAQYRQWVEEARAMYPYPQSTDKMWRVMMCESGGNARASGGGGRYLGLFQYAPGTWAGGWNPYRNNSMWDGRSQIFATAKAWSIGMQGHWSCFYITSGN
jgi:uncharacterized protein YraI